MSISDKAKIIAPKNAFANANFAMTNITELSQNHV